MMNENEKILKLVISLMENDTLSDFLTEYDYSVNLFGLKISDSRHYFLRLSKPQNDVVLWMQEEYIPKLDINGNWIEYPAIENPRVERLEPSVKYIPTDLTYEEFKKNLFQFFDLLKGYKANHLKNIDSTKLDNDIDALIQEIQAIS